RPILGRPELAQALRGLLAGQTPGMTLVAHPVIDTGAARSEPCRRRAMSSIRAVLLVLLALLLGDLRRVVALLLFLALLLLCHRGRASAVGGGVRRAFVLRLVPEAVVIGVGLDAVLDQLLEVGHRQVALASRVVDSKAGAQRPAGRAV